MGLLPAALKTELQKPAPAARLVLEISLLGGGTLRLTDVEGGPLSSDAQGPVEAKVRSWGRSSRAIADPDQGLRPVTWDPVVENGRTDTDPGLRQYLHRIRGRAATITVVSPNVSSVSSYFPQFVGVVEDYEDAEGGAFVLHLRQDDAGLDTEFPNQLISPYDWPNLHRDAQGQPYPIVLGRHDRSGLGAGGMCPTYLVDTVAGWFLCAGFFAKSVPRVYGDGVIKATPGDYSILKSFEGGRWATLIDWVGAVPAVVTCDIDGVETVGDGSGTLVQHPVDMLTLLFSNWLLDSYRLGAYASTHSIFDATSLATTKAFMTAMNLASGARWVGKELRSGRDELNQWCHDFQISAFWTNSGKLGLLPYEHRLQGAGAYPTNRIRVREEVLAEPGQSFDGQAYVATTVVRHVHHVTGQVFEENYLASIEVRDTASGVTTVDEMKCRWLPAEANQQNIARLVASGRINRRKGLIPDLELRVPLWYLDFELYADFLVSWDDGPNEDGTLGWGDKPWEARPFRLVEVTTDGDALELVLRLKDIKPTQTSFWATYSSQKTVAADAADGIAHIGVGTGTTITRASSKYVDDPATGYVVTLGNNVTPQDATGLLIEGQVTNRLKRSGFASGLTGYTVFGVAGTGSVVASSSDRLYATASLQHIVMTANNPHAAAAGFFTTALTAVLAANTRIGISVDHTSGEALRLSVTRSSDGFFLRLSDKTWVAADPTNLLTATGARVREIFENIDIGGAGAALNISLTQLAGGTGGRINRVYSLEIHDPGRVVGSRIFSDGAVDVTRSADVVSVANDGADGFDLWPNRQGTITLSVIPNADDANLATGTKLYVLHLEYSTGGAGAAMGVYWDHDTASWVAEWIVGGTSFKASKAGALTAGDLAIRYTGSDGELNLAVGTLDIFFNGSKGTSAVFTTPPTRVAAKSVYFGCKTGGTNQFDGSLKHIRFSPYCKSDAEIAADLAV